MRRIDYFYHDERTVPLTIPSITEDDTNTYTVIVGKNGVGKSRLLANMVNEFTMIERYLPNILSIDREELQHEPRVIAVSTSPFDKFKLPPRGKSKEQYTKTNYRYVGMRSSGPYGSSSISLISSATHGILERFLKHENYDRLCEVFETLGFSTEIQLIFKPSFKSTRYLSSDISSKIIPNSLILKSDTTWKNIYHPLELEWINELGIELSPKILDNIVDLNEEDKWKITRSINNLKNVLRYDSAISISINFSHGDVFSLNKELYQDKELLESLNILLKLNLIHLMDMKLHKHEFGSMSLRRASSGEQCMLVMILGIAGNINDNSLVFIDEPEISLHPRWQEDFMSLLIKTFSKYRGCQFFIATHSPQIVSKLKSENCFVTSLSSNEIFSASFFYNRSSDFQLAELFDAPGSRNEYVSRLVFGLLSRIKKQKAVGDEDYELLNKLLSMLDLIESNDPVHDLILSVKEIVDHYASTSN
ncbi:AAA family ATPase [Methylobacter sp.]|uniref:AAA family ATPase n=1 Tax=Methylobacter sp. TaxID=2051955 RepID=UPI002FDEE0A1